MKFVKQFSRPRKSLEIEIKSAKLVKGLEFFFIPFATILARVALRPILEFV